MSRFRMSFLLQALLMMSVLIHLSLARSNGFEETRRDCGCGSGTSPLDDRSADDNRIVNGTIANIEDIPYQAAIEFLGYDDYGFLGRYRCGGTLLNKKYILSAAHCFEDKYFGHKVTLGVQKFNQHGPGSSKTYRPKQVVVHPKYNPYACSRSSSPYDNDIAIVELPEEVEFRSSIQPACLPSSSSNTYYGQQAIVSGYGTLYWEGPVSKELMTTKQQIVHEDDEVCQANVQARCLFKIDKSMLCAYTDGTDSCQGDSGGPLIVSENGRNTVVGVVSFGHECAVPNYASVYAKVTEFLEWINGIVEDGWCN